MGSANLTPRQLEILVAVVAEMPAAEVNWEKVAANSKCKTAKYARDQFNGIRKLLAAAAGNVTGNGNGNTTNGTTAPKTPKSGSAKKTAAKKRGKDSDEGEDEAESPTKKKKAATPRKSKSATPAAEKVDTPTEEKEEGETEVKDEPNEAGDLMDEMTASA